LALETATASDTFDDWRHRSQPSLAADPLNHVEVDGKHFKAGDKRFPFRGVTYGTFARRADGALFPENARIRADIKAIASAGFTVVRTYTPPPPDMLDAARDFGLRILAGIDYQQLLGLLEAVLLFGHKTIPCDFVVQRDAVPDPNR